jgi:hypothetical protein
MMNFSLRAFAMSAAVVGLSACGTPQKTDTAGLLEGAEGQAQALVDAEEAIISSLGFSVEKVGAQGGNAECKALRVKLSAEKTRLMYGSDWRSLGDTPAFAAFSEDKEKFSSLKCAYDAPVAGLTEECALLRTRIQQDWQVIFTTPEWDKVAKNSYFGTYQTNLSRAKAIGCYAP